MSLETRTPEPAPNRGPTALSRARIVGSWRLVEHGVLGEDQRFHPTDPGVTGRLTYEMNGSMAAVLLKEKPLLLAGRYTVSPDRVTHELELASGFARASATLENGRLVLVAPAAAQGQALRTTWERVDAAASGASG